MQLLPSVFWAFFLLEEVANCVQQKQRHHHLSPPSINVPPHNQTGQTMDGSANHQLYSIWAPIDKSAGLHDVIANYSKELGTPLFDPHVTIIGGLEHLSLAEIKAVAADVASDFVVKQKGRGEGAGGILIECDEVASSDKYWQSVYLPVKSDTEGALQLESLHLKARELAYEKRGVPFKGPNDEYMPHVSLIYSDKPVDQKRQWRDRVFKALFGSTETSPPLATRIDRISVMLTDMSRPVSEWRVVQDFPLNTTHV